MGYTATWAGIAAAPVGILAIILSPIVGKSLNSGHDPRIIATMAFLIFSLISFMRAEYNTQVDLYGVILPTFLQGARSEENTSELQSLMRTSYAVFCLKKKTKKNQ